MIILIAIDESLKVLINAWLCFLQY